MEMKDVLKKLREKNSLTQEQMAKRVMVTRQAVSRWETGDTLPNTETLKLFVRGKVILQPQGKEFFT